MGSQITGRKSFFFPSEYLGKHMNDKTNFYGHRVTIGLQFYRIKPTSYKTVGNCKVRDKVVTLFDFPVSVSSNGNSLRSIIN